jgi:hypothetical protein
VSTLDDRKFRRLLSDLLRDLADKIDRREVDAVEFSALAAAECPPGFAVHSITFRVRRS